MGDFDFLQTKKEHRIAGRNRWKKIKRGAKAKAFRIRQEASRSFQSHRKLLDTQGILADEFDFVKEYNPRWLRTRAFILKRDKFRCYCCTAESGRNHVHHKLPRRYRGSSDSAENLITVCPKCHSQVDLEIWRQVETGPDRTPNEIKVLCLRILEARKRLMSNAIRQGS
jgi:hypothetical protein